MGWLALVGVGLGLVGFGYWLHYQMHQIEARLLRARRRALGVEWQGFQALDELYRLHFTTAGRIGSHEEQLRRPTNGQ